MRKLYIPPIETEKDLMLVLDELAFRTHMRSSRLPCGALIRKFHKILLWFANQNELDKDQHQWFKLSREKENKTFI